MTNRPPTKSRGTLLVLVVLFAAPLASAFLLYYGSGWRPANHTNHGQLIEPVVAVPGNVYSGKWSLVVVGTGEAGCDARCRGALIYARQTWLSLGKLTPRAQRVLLGGEGCCDRDYLQREHPGLITVPASAAGAVAMRQAFPAPRDDTIYVVDPLGNLMMRYDVHDNPSGLREDLKKLLELSHIG